MGKAGIKINREYLNLKFANDMNFDERIYKWTIMGDLAIVYSQKVGIQINLK